MPPVSTTSLRAGEVMLRAAALMNDPEQTDYTNTAVLPYLNMAVDELMEALEEANASPTNQTSTAITVPVGTNKLTPTDDADTPHYPYDLVEIQEIGERASGSSDLFTPMGRREFIDEMTITTSLMVWAWEDQYIKFNPNGASSEREVQLRYVRQPIQLAQNEVSLIGTIGSRSFLSYKTASLCAQFIGENESRAAVLDGKAQESLDRMLNINSKGRQQMITRRRPFRAGYKRRGWV